MTRVVTLGSGRRVSLRAYVRAIKIAKAHPDHWFPDGLDGWGATGAEVVRQFRAGMHDRINAGVPAASRGL